MKFWTAPGYHSLFNPKTVFEDAAALEGEIFRRAKGRVTLRFTWRQRRFFIKRHSGVGWKEIFKELLQARLPVVTAINEQRALQRLKVLNISCPNLVAWGCSGVNPARRRSFVVTQELENTINLETLIKDWRQRADFVPLKRAIIRQAALLLRRMHCGGINHRDMYICHIHISRAWLDKPAGDPELFIIDLHRAQIRPRVPRRWLVKDIAGLYFSSMDAGLTEKDRLRFIKIYRDAELKDILHREMKLWTAVRQRAMRLYAKHSTPSREKYGDEGA